MTNIKCDYCENEFYKVTAEIARTNHNFCSKNCAGKHKARKAKMNFYNNMSINLNSGCFEWQKCTNCYGYGVARFNGKSHLAHRVSYKLTFPDFDINSALHVLHKCDNPKCVNPAHLFVGTHSDNMADMHKKFRGSCKLTYSSLNKIRKSSEKENVLSQMYGVSTRTIRRAREKQGNNYRYYTHWKPLPEPPKGE